MNQESADAPERRYVVEVTAPLPSGRVRFVAAEAAARLNLPVEKLVGLLENRVGPVTKPLALASAERVAEVLDRAGAEVALRDEDEPDAMAAGAAPASYGRSPESPSDEPAAERREATSGEQEGDDLDSGGEGEPPARKTDDGAWSAVEGQFAPEADRDEEMLGRWTGGWRDRSQARDTRDAQGEDVVTTGSAPGGQGAWPGGGVVDADSSSRTPDHGAPDAARDAFDPRSAPPEGGGSDWDPIDTGEAAAAPAGEERPDAPPSAQTWQREAVVREQADPPEVGRREEGQGAWPRDERIGGGDEEDDELEEAFPMYGYGTRDPFEEGRRQEVAQRRWVLAGALVVALLAFLALQWAYSDRSVGASAPPPYEAGLHAYRGGAFVSAARAWRRRAEAGDPRAMFMLGYMAEMGQGRPWSNAEAASWYREAAERGLAPAQARLASLHLRGLGVERSRSAALHWYEEAGRAGDARAQLEAGRLLFRERRFDRALAWFEAAAPHEEEAAAFVAFVRDERAMDGASR